MTELIGPDFICAGMPKAGTGWLFQQLYHHPDFWMSPIKEYHYFDTVFPKATILDTIRDAREDLDTFNRGRGRLGFPRLTERDQLFFDDVLSCSSGGTDLDEYARLFRQKNGQLSGDITPDYCGLNELSIARIAKAFPDLKVIFLVRDPVARCWSRLQMRERRAGFLEDKLDDAERFKVWFLNAGEGLNGYQTEIFARWKAHFPEGRVRHFLFDEIARSPKKLRRKVLHFLDADASKDSGDVNPHFNSKSRNTKIAMPDEIKKILVDHFADEIRASTHVFGPRARPWLRRYNLKLPGGSEGADDAQSDFELDSEEAARGKDLRKAYRFTPRQCARHGIS